MSSEPVIEARGLGKAYPIYRKPEDRLKQLLWGGRRRFYEEFWAVRDVHLSVRRGETVGIIGRNGSGKSTLLQMICGTLRPSAGEVCARGRVAAMLELGSGFNPQFTGRENIRVGAAVLGLSAGEIDARFDDIAGFADIGAFIDQPMTHYSSGMHARLAFAVCANVDADVLVIDEILSVGDAAFQQKCMRYLNRFRLHGTMLFVSHDSGAIAKLCDRALWLEQGEVRGVGPSKEMCRLYLAAQAEETAGDASGFRVGGRAQRSLSTNAERVCEAPAAETGPSSGDLAFDPDETGGGTGEAEILSIGFHDGHGARLHVAKGGEYVQLRVRCRAHRRLIEPIVAFAVRDRLGQIIFSDDTLSALEAAPAIEARQGFTAVFGFLLPYLASGVYALQGFVFAGAAPDRGLAAKRIDSDFLHMHSAHPSNGLANVAMRNVTITVCASSGGANAADWDEETNAGLRAAV